MGFLSLFEFCHLDDSVNQNGSILPASQQVLMRFCSHLADRLHHSSIKVYLSGICSLHLDMGFSDPLSNCLQLQRVLCSISNHQGSHESPCQSVTGEFKEIQSSLVPKNDLHSIFWAACCLGFFWLFKGFRIYCQLLFRRFHSPLLSGPICNWIPHPTPPKIGRASCRERV